MNEIKLIKKDVDLLKVEFEDNQYLLLLDNGIVEKVIPDNHYFNVITLTHSERPEDLQYIDQCIEEARKLGEKLIGKKEEELF